MRVFNIVILFISIISLCNCSIFCSDCNEEFEEHYNYIYNKTNQTITIYHYKLKNDKNQLKSNEKIEIKTGSTIVEAVPPVKKWSGVFKIIFSDGKILACKRLWNYNLLLFNNRVFPKDTDFKMLINEKSWKVLDRNKFQYEITEEDYKKSEYLTHMKFSIKYNIPKYWFRKIRFYHYNGTEIKNSNYDYFAKGKNNFVVPPVYTDSCTITFSNGSDKKILKYSGRYDNATRHSPLHKKYWTKQSDTEYYYTITREDFEAAEDL